MLVLLQSMFMETDTDLDTGTSDTVTDMENRQEHRHRSGHGQGSIEFLDFGFGQSGFGMKKIDNAGSVQHWNRVVQSSTFWSGISLI